MTKTSCPTVSIGVGSTSAVAGWVATATGTAWLSVGFACAGIEAAGTVVGCLGEVGAGLGAAVDAFAAAEALEVGSGC